MKSTGYTLTLFAAVAPLWLGALPTALPAAQAPTQAPTHVMATVADAKWSPAPAMLPPGAQIVVLTGDPGKPAPFTVRLKFPANYTIPAHSHPGDENVTVISGELFMGMGKTVNKSEAMGLGLGGYAMLPANTNHFAFTKGETTIVLFGTGPLDFKYVNAAEDPRGVSNSK